jgi:hypothetical protein
MKFAGMDSDMFPGMWSSVVVPADPSLMGDYCSERPGIVDSFSCDFTIQNLPTFA